MCFSCENVVISSLIEFLQGTWEEKKEKAEKKAEWKGIRQVDYYAIECKQREKTGIQIIIAGDKKKKCFWNVVK